MRDFLDKTLLLEEIHNGSEKAFKYLFSTYYPRLRNFASHFISDTDAVDDIIQDAFMQLWKRHNTIEPISLQSLIFTMVRNGCLNYLKHQAIEHDYQTYTENRIAGNEQLYYSDMLENPDQELMMKELQEHINSILEKLPERSREVFLLSRHEGLKNREIAEKLNISIKVVERHISKALNLFRSSLSAEMALYADLILFITLAE